MKAIRMTAVKLLWFTAMLAPLIGAPVDYRAYSELLARYVEEDGVRYESWASHPEDRAALQAFLDLAAGTEVDSLPRADQVAFYINLYNAAMLSVVLEHWPIDSVRDIGPEPFSIFRKPLVAQGGRLLSLDQIEKEILLKEFFDPRIHFAVNCASESCPPLLPEPYDGARLEAQLEERNRAFAQSSRAVELDRSGKTAAFSELFKWYQEDFPGEHPALYLNRYRDEPIPIHLEITWIPYDWALNLAR